MKLLDKYTYQQRAILALSAVIIISLLAYSRSIRSTIRVAKEVHQLEDKWEKMKFAEEHLIKLKTQIQQLAQIDLEGKETEQRILDRVSALCGEYNITLTSFPAAHHYAASDFEVVTYKLVLEGKFIPLVKFVHEMETKFESAKITSVKYESQQLIQSKQKKLYATLLLQNIRSFK